MRAEEAGVYKHAALGDVEAAAMLRIANAIARELPAVTSRHWHRALTELREGLSECAERRSQRYGPSSYRSAERDAAVLSLVDLDDWKRGE